MRITQEHKENLIIDWWIDKEAEEEWVLEVAEGRTTMSLSDYIDKHAGYTLNHYSQHEIDSHPAVRQARRAIRF